MAGVPGINAGGNLAGGSGIFFQSGSGSAEPGICTRVKSARHDLSGGRNPADGAGRIDLPERLFSDTGTDKWYNFYLIQTIQIAGAMAVAIFIVDSLFRLLRNKAS